MRGTKAKRIRKLIYGDLSSNARSRKYRVIGGAMIVADDLRRRYQYAKRNYEIIMNRVREKVKEAVCKRSYA